VIVQWVVWLLGIAESTDMLLSGFIIIIIIIIIIIFFFFMQGIYTYIPQTNYVPREYSVAAILLSWCLYR